MNTLLKDNLNASGQPVPGNWKFRFFTIWTGQALSMFGTSIVSFALIWWLTEKTGSAQVLAASTLFALLPRIVLGPFVGTLVDKFKRKSVLLVGNSVVALLTFGLVLLFYFEITIPWQIILIIFLREIGLTFKSTAMSASTTLMVPESQLSRIGGVNHTLAGVLRIVGAPTGALLITWFPVHTVLSIDIITAIIAIVSLIIIVIPQPPKQPTDDLTKKDQSSFLEQTKEGLQFVLRWKALFWVVMTCTFANVFIGPSIAFQPLLVTRVFGGGALELSYISIAAGTGAILGGLLMSAWKGFKRRLITGAVGWIGIGVTYMVASLTPANMYPMFLAMIFLAGVSTPVGCAPVDAFYQSCIPAEKQGRVLSVLNSIDGLTMPFGLIIAWMIGDIVPFRAWFLLLGLSHAVLGFVWLGIPFIRRAEDEARQRLLALSTIQDER